VNPTDIAGLFSRYFVVGFYVPTFAALAVLGAVVGVVHDLPEVYSRYSPQTRLLIDGAVALPLALALSGLHQPILEWFRGAPLWRRRDRRVFAGLYLWKTKRARDRFESLTKADADPHPSPARTSAAWNLDRRYPASEDQLFPTRFGNIMRATEYHGYKRYGLDQVVVWPRVEMLLGQAERDVHESVRGDVAFFVNVCLGTGAIAVVSTVLGVADRSPGVIVGAVGATLVLGLSYLAVLQAALRWGDAVRSSVDLHRLELYRLMGLRSPLTPQQEVAIGRALTRCLLYSEPLADTVRARVPANADDGG
jgi:hypothetical protein